MIWDAMVLILQHCKASTEQMMTSPKFSNFGKKMKSWNSMICNTSTSGNHHKIKTITHSGLITCTLQWRHNERDGVSNHQPHDCLLNLYSDADQSKHQSSASLAFVWGIHRGPVNSPHKWPVTRKMFQFDDVIMACLRHRQIHHPNPC